MSPRLRFYLGVFLLTGSTMMLEVVQTRLLSVVTWYHHAFFVNIFLSRRQHAAVEPIETVPGFLQHFVLGLGSHLKMAILGAADGRAEPIRG